ncbi:MAG: YutD family protein [Lactobacillus sp.]|nr:YutD family protein [Lactobacillus sp.]
MKKKENSKEEFAPEENKYQQKQPIRHPLAKVVLDENKIKINEQLYKIVIDKFDAIDVEMLREKYDPYLNQYDFLVGDISSDHLRLKGFYKDNVRTSIDRKQKAIADYLTEYCNPGGAYFVLQLISPVHHYNTNTHLHEKQNREYHKKRYSKKNMEFSFKKKKVHRTKFKKRQTVAVKKSRGKHQAFVIKKKKRGKKNEERL